MLIGLVTRTNCENPAGKDSERFKCMYKTTREASSRQEKAIAKSLGANAIVGLRLMSSSVMAGAAEMVAYGTAVVVK